MKKLNFGCGEDIRKEWDNADIIKLEGVNLIFDFDKFPYPIEDNTYEYVYSDNVFEHLDYLEKTVLELWRICKPNAEIRVIVPYYNYSGAFNSVHHKRWFNNHTLRILFGCENVLFGSDYESAGKFEIINQKFNVRKGLGWIPQKIIIPISHFIPNLIGSIDIRIRVKK